MSSKSLPADLSIIDTIDQLHAINGAPSDRTTVKIQTSLDEHAARFIARCPFAVVATTSGDSADASPRGDGPGFIKILDGTTLLIPERPGNRLADTMGNIINNPAIGILMMIPGMDETLRVNGNAYVTDAPQYLEPLAHEGKVPKLAIAVAVREVYFHCPKAYIRSKLWDPATRMKRSDLPSLGKMLLDQIKHGDVTDEEVKGLDDALAADVRDNLY